MGAPAALTPDELARLQGLTEDRPETDRAAPVGPDGVFSLDLPLRANDVALVQLELEG